MDITLQTDGWTGINSHHLLAFMITTSARKLTSKKVHTVRVTDVSTEQQTADHLKRIILDVKDSLEKDWKVTVIAITSDASGESRAARKRILVDFPWLMVPDCYAHQKAMELIMWLHSKTHILALMCDIQKAVSMANGSKTRILSVIRAVLTRWTAHYLAFRCLLDLKLVLEMLVTREKEAPRESKIMVTGDIAARKKGADMLATIEDPLFWHTVLRIVKHIEPLALAANLTQTAHCQLDEVLITFGFLISQYHLEKRWGKCDQEVFITATILNPVYKISPFAQLSIFTNSGVYGILSQLWQRFYQENPPPTLLSELYDYLDNKVLSICANSASCERLFSTFGTILTKLRSRLSLQNMVNLTELRLHLRDEYMCKMEMHERLNTAAPQSSSGVAAHLELLSPASSSNTSAFLMQTEATTSVSDRITDTSTATNSSAATLDESASGLSEEGSLSAITQTLVERSDLDDIGTDHDFTPALEKIKLTQLFNFSDTTWTEIVRKMSMKSLDEELEFYELVEMDAEGEADDVDIANDPMFSR
ncbi:ribonuclease H-like domain-containing protein [Melanogaster broomeanus]|nr:ribonuclease H-like domain-containing protein [Melanogaster broomeanus]